MDSMEVYSLVLFGALLWGGGELVYGIWTWLRRFEIRFQHQAEMTQRHFAQARNELMRATIEGEIDPDSSVFKLFYAVNTALMRRPDQYEEISNALAPILILEDDESSEEAIRREMQALSPRALKAIEATPDALGHLVVDYSFFFRIFYRLTRKAHPEASPIDFLLAMREATKSQREQDVKKEVERARDDIYRLLPAS